MTAEKQSEYRNGDVLEVEKPILGTNFVEVIYDGLILKGGINVKNPLTKVGLATIIDPSNKIIRKLSAKEVQKLKGEK